MQRRFKIETSIHLTIKIPYDKDKECYSGKLGKVRWHLNMLPDGIYELEQANSNVMSSVRRYRSYLKIENWQIIQEWDSLAELIEDVVPKVTSSLPALEGSFKQIAWAESIREKAIEKGLSIETGSTIISAKEWIERRNDFS